MTDLLWPLAPAGTLDGSRGRLGCQGQPVGRIGDLRYNSGTPTAAREPGCSRRCLGGMSDVLMDAHTLELLEFNKVRELLAGYAASSLGKDLARQAEPSTDPDRIRAEIALVSEMVEALAGGQAPPFGGLHDVRLLVRRAAIGSMLTAEQLLEVADTLNCTGNMYRYRMRLDGRLLRLIELLTPIEDLGAVAKTISGCIDGRGHVLDMASRDLAQVRQKLADLDERVQDQIRRLLRDPELRKILRYPNATVSGDHYVLPVAVNHRHKVPGVVHRTSSTGETLFVEPAAVAKLSAERAVLKGEEERELRRVLRRLTAEVARVARPLTFAIDIMARLDLITAKARYSLDYNMYAPEINTEGRLWLRQARHPLLEYLFRGASGGCEPPGCVSPGADPLARVPQPPLAGSSVVQVSRTDPASAETQEGDVLGTPAYMAPEQALGEINRLDQRCDVFSLGAILCEVLTGLPPYAGGDRVTVLRQARRAELSEALGRLETCEADEELVDLARRCLSAEPNSRPRDASEVARAVETYLAGVEERARQAELERAPAQARGEEARVREKVERERADEAERREAVEKRARRLTLGLAASVLLLGAAGGSGAWLMQKHRAEA